MRNTSLAEEVSMPVIDERAEIAMGRFFLQPTFPLPLKKPLPMQRPWLIDSVRLWN